MTLNLAAVIVGSVPPKPPAVALEPVAVQGAEPAVVPVGPMPVVPKFVLPDFCVPTIVVPDFVKAMLPPPVVTPRWCPARPGATGARRHTEVVLVPYLVLPAPAATPAVVLVPDPVLPAPAATPEVVPAPDPVLPAPAATPEVVPTPDPVLPAPAATPGVLPAPDPVLLDSVVGETVLGPVWAPERALELLALVSVLAVPPPPLLPSAPAWATPDPPNIAAPTPRVSAPAPSHTVTS